MGARFSCKTCDTTTVRRSNGHRKCTECPVRPCLVCKKHRGDRDHICRRCEKAGYRCGLCHEMPTCRRMNNCSNMLMCDACVTKVYPCDLCEKPTSNGLTNGRRCCNACLRKVYRDCGKCMHKTYEENGPYTVQQKYYCPKCRAPCRSCNNPTPNPHKVCNRCIQEYKCAVCNHVGEEPLLLRTAEGKRFCQKCTRNCGKCGNIIVKTATHGVCTPCLNANKCTKCSRYDHVLHEMPGGGRGCSRCVNTCTRCKGSHKNNKWAHTQQCDNCRHVRTCEKCRHTYLYPVKYMINGKRYCYKCGEVCKTCKEQVLKRNLRGSSCTDCHIKHTCVRCNKWKDHTKLHDGCYYCTDCLKPCTFCGTMQSQELCYGCAPYAIKCNGYCGSSYDSRIHDGCPVCVTGECTICFEMGPLISGCVCDNDVCIKCYRTDFDTNERQRCLGCNQPCFLEQYLTEEQRAKVLEEAKKRLSVLCAPCHNVVSLLDETPGGYLYRGTPDELYAQTPRPNPSDISSMELRSRYQVYCALRQTYVSTKCCNSKYCWKCMARCDNGNHKCSDAVGAHNVRRCPGCNASVVKTDGCDVVRCLCGQRFRFDSAVQVR